MKNTYKFTLCLLIFHTVTCQFSDYINIAINKLGNVLGERCTDEWIPFNTSDLQKDLDNHLFGQPLVNNFLAGMIVSHIEHNSEKPLILSFHGMPGVGKTYVIEFIMKRLYKKGARSKYVHSYVGSMHFPLEKNVEEYKTTIEKEIMDGVNSCSKSLFIFDEVHKLHPAILNQISSLITAQRLTDKMLKDAVFIFTSNIGFQAINERTQELIKKGFTREEFKLSDFDHMLREVANNEGGLEKSELITQSFIDHYIPFLPLEKEHIKKCINAEIIKGNINNDHIITDTIIETVISEAVVFGPEPENLFSQSGCKRISQKLHMLTFAQKLKSENNKIDL